MKIPRPFRDLSRTAILLFVNLSLATVVTPMMFATPLTAQELPGEGGGEEGKKGCCKLGTDRKKYCCTDCCQSLKDCDKSSDCRGTEEPED